MLKYMLILKYKEQNHNNLISREWKYQKIVHAALEGALNHRLFQMMQRYQNVMDYCAQGKEMNYSFQIVTQGIGKCIYGF